MRVSTTENSSVTLMMRELMSIPHLFRCPISLDLFTDPVTLSTGQTYDRPSIERWLADGNLTCPVTMQRLEDTSLVPNHTLSHLIHQWLINSFSLSNLKHSLHSPETLRKVRALSVESDIGRATLIQLGFYPLLLQLLFQSPSMAEPEIVEVALDCVLILSASPHLGSLNMLTKDPPSLASIGFLLEAGSAKIKTRLCYLLETIAMSPVTRELCVAIGKTRRVLQAIVSLLHGGNTTSEASVRAIYAICCSVEANRDYVIREGAVEGLIFYLSGSTCGKSTTRALAALELLLGAEMGRRAVIKNARAVGVLVRLVFRVSWDDDEGSEHAVGSLLVACQESPRARGEAVRAGVVKQLLLLLQSQCGSRAKGKARALLKLLRAIFAEESGKM